MICCMRLFLTSHDFGNYENELLKLMGKGRRALLIANARDYLSGEERKAVVSRKMGVMERAGIEAEELDLREYFGKKDELAERISSYGPDLIFAIGGSVFLLATAYHLSGFDEVARRDLDQDKYVYGGGSAGAMVTVDTLKYYGHGELSPDAVPGVYGVDAVLDGLGLIDGYIVAHADVPEHLGVTKMYREHIEGDGQKAIILNQLSVMIVDGEKTTILS